MSVDTTPTRALLARPGPHSRARRAIVSVVAALGLPIVIVTIWWFASAGSTNYLSPPLSTVLEEFWPTWFGTDESGQTRFQRDVLPGLTRLLIGYACAIVIGIALGIALGSLPRLRAFCEPGLEFFRAVPASILVPILMLFFGIGDMLRIVAIVIGSLWPVLLNTVEGVRGIDPTLSDTASTYRLGFWRRLTRLTLPGASPQIVTGARQALPIAIIMMVVSEMFAATDGLGAAIVTFQRSFAVAQTWGGVIMLGVIGVLLAVVFNLVTKPILSWYHGYLRAQRGA